LRKRHWPPFAIEVERLSFFNDLGAPPLSEFRGGVTFRGALFAWPRPRYPSPRALCAAGSSPPPVAAAHPFTSLAQSVLRTLLSLMDATVRGRDQQYLK
jgi:hypothetical protein